MIKPCTKGSHVIVPTINWKRSFDLLLLSWKFFPRVLCYMWYELWDRYRQWEIAVNNGSSEICGRLVEEGIKLSARLWPIWFWWNVHRWSSEVCWAQYEVILKHQVKRLVEEPYEANDFVSFQENWRPYCVSLSCCSKMWKCQAMRIAVCRVV